MQFSLLYAISFIVQYICVIPFMQYFAGSNGAQINSSMELHGAFPLINIAICTFLCYMQYALHRAICTELPDNFPLGAFAFLPHVSYISLAPMDGIQSLICKVLAFLSNPKKTWGPLSLNIASGAIQWTKVYQSINWGSNL